jgi:hypothetical protein
MMPTDWWIDLIVVMMLSAIIVQNMGLRDRLKALEAKLGRRD